MQPARGLGAGGDGDGDGEARAHPSPLPCSPKPAGLGGARVWEGDIRNRGEVGLEGTSRGHLVQRLPRSYRLRTATRE